MMLQRLATGATGVKQARYRRRPTRGSEALVRACAVYTQRSSLLLTAYEFRRGFCTLVLSLSCLSVYLSVCLSVPALAASASVGTSKQQYLRVSLRLFLD